MRYLYMEQIFFFNCQYRAASHAKQASHAKSRGVCSSSLPKQPWQLSSTFEFYWVLIDHILFEWGHTGCNQVFSCKQFGDFFLDRWEMFVLHPFTKKSWQLSSTFCIYWVMTDHVLFERAFTSYNQVFSCKQFGDFFLDRWEMFVLPPSTKKSRQLSSTFLHLLNDDWSCFVWMSSYKLQPGHQL